MGKRKNLNDVIQFTRAKTILIFTFLFFKLKFSVYNKKVFTIADNIENTKRRRLVAYFRFLDF